MKILATAALGIIVVIAAGVCLLSSICAVSGGFSGGGRLGFAICAVTSLAIAWGGAMLIAKINRAS